MARVISLFAGPSAGKSTCAAYLYAQMKARGYSAELVREYVKDWAWEKRPLSRYDQFYILGKQIRRESFLLDKVDVLITDSPVWLCGFYAEEMSPPLIKHGVESCIQGYYQQTRIDGHEHTYVWVNRPRTFDPRGRYHSEEESLDVDNKLKPFLIRRGVKLIEVSADFDSLDAFVENLD